MIIRSKLWFMSEGKFQWKKIQMFGLFWLWFMCNLLWSRNHFNEAFDWPSNAMHINEKRFWYLIHSIPNLSIFNRFINFKISFMVASQFLLNSHNHSPVLSVEKWAWQKPLYKNMSLQNMQTPQRKWYYQFIFYFDLLCKIFCRQIFVV